MTTRLRVSCDVETKNTPRVQPWGGPLRRRGPRQGTAEPRPSVSTPPAPALRVQRLKARHVAVR